MGREQMRNLEVFKIGGSQVNEFEYQKHQGEMTEQERHDKQIGATKPLTRAEQIKEVMAAAHKKVEKRRKKEGARTGGFKKVSATKRKSETSKASGKPKSAGDKTSKKGAKKAARKR